MHEFDGALSVYRIHKEERDAHALMPKRATETDAYGKRFVVSVAFIHDELQSPRRKPLPSANTDNRCSLECACFKKESIVLMKA